MYLNAIILAAGKGKRMQSKTIPKVLHELAGKPVLAYVIDSLYASGVNDPVIVVGFQGQKIVDQFPSYRYAWQRKRLGTAHAALQAKEFLKDKQGYTFILYADNPLLSSETLKRIAREVESQNAIAAIASAQAPDDFGLGHIIINQQGSVTDIVEKKVITPQLKKNNPWQNAGGWLVRNDWFWQNLPKIKKNPVSGESYLTDLVALAVSQGKKVIAVPVSNLAEAIGINTPEHLEAAHQWLRTKRKE